MVSVKGGPGRFQTRHTPTEDNPKATRGPIAVRDPGPATPIYGHGSLQGPRGADSHPMFGAPGIRAPTKRVDISQDARRELDG